MNWLKCLSAAVVVSAAATSLAYGQAFAEAKQSLVDYSSATLQPRKPCNDALIKKLPEIVEAQAKQVVATDSTPGFCVVRGTLAPEISFEVSLPDKWNGRFYMIGNGGHAGESLEDPSRTSQRTAALQNGFAVAQTNTGHDSRKEPGASFVMSNPQKAIDYAYRAVHLTATTAKEITKAFYGRKVAKSYWNSCSNGGRQGLIEAQRFPDDFDGVIANAPWVSQTGFSIGALWNQRALVEAPLTAVKMGLLAEKVMNKCDAIDGLKDGLIDDPRKCEFDAKRDVPICAVGIDAPDCLTAAQASTINKIYQGPRDSQGRQLFPGFALSSEALVPTASGTEMSGWMNLIVPSANNTKAADFNLADNTLRYLAHNPPKPDYDYLNFNFDTDVALFAEWSKKVDATETDLAKFRKRGGKLLMTYGWADAVLQPMMGVNYYEQALVTNGPKTPDFFRLFMVPGMTHCSGGVGPSQIDTVTAIVNWVEKGKAPDVLQASRVLKGNVVRTRPLCPYPQVARYAGNGSIDEAKNFSCVKS
jgi:hypothetical protein